MDFEQARRDLTTDGRLRAAINLGNPILAQAVHDDIRGVTVDLAGALAERLDAPLDLVRFSSARYVVENVHNEALNVAFLAIDPRRANELSFTAPYVLLEGNYVVRDDAPVQANEDIDQTGRSIGVVKGSAYDLHLTATLKNATIVRHAAHEEAVTAFRNENLTAIAGIRQPMADLAGSNPGLRLIETPFMTIRQAMAVPRGRPAGLAYLNLFLDEMRRSGFVADALERSGQSKAATVP